jgi:hypothetical protein
MSSQTDIEKAFTTTFAALGYAYVSYPNAPVVAPSALDLNYTVDMLYGSGRAAGIGADAANAYRGIFQVTIRAPVTSATGDAPGIGAALDAAGAVASAFRYGKKVVYGTDVSVQCGTPAIKHFGKVDPTWYVAIVSVPWYCELAP